MTLPFGQASFPELYERELVGPLFRPWAELLLEDVAAGTGDRVLDVAAGTGIVARLARVRVGGSGRIVGVDVNPAMLEVANALAPEVEWRKGDAAALPLGDDEVFDVVCCQQGLQFFPDRLAAARQMRRALAPGGRLAVSVWSSDESFPVLRELRRIAETRLGPIADRRHAFGEPGPVEALLRDAGFRDVRSKSVSLKVRYADGSVFVRLNAMALVGMSAASSGLADEERGRLVEAISDDSAGVVRDSTDASGFAYEIGATVAIAGG